MNVALDLGSNWFRSLRVDGSRLISRRSRAVFATLPDSAAQRGLLERAGVSYAVGDDYLALIGQAADEFSPAFQSKCRELLPFGDLPADDPVARQVIALLVEALLPKASSAGELCCLIRCGGESDPGRLSRRTEFFSRLIRLQGYQPVKLSAGMSVVYAGLADQGFTGIGLDLGASGCDMAVAHRGVPVASCWVPRGGRWIDEQLARRQQWIARDSHGRSKPDVLRAATNKLVCHGTLLNPAGDGEKILAKLYRELLIPAMQKLTRTLTICGEATLPHPQPLTIVCTGGVTQVPGFVEFLHQFLREMPLPVPVGSVRLAEDADYALLRGGLIHTEVECLSRQQSRKAA